MEEAGALFGREARQEEEAQQVDSNSSREEDNKALGECASATSSLAAWATSVRSAGRRTTSRAVG